MTGMEVCLGDIVTIGRGSSPRPIKDEKYFKDGSIPWVKIADATASGKYIIQTKQFVNEYGASFSRHLKKGSLIISASGTLGTPYFLGVDACIHDGWLYFSDYAGVEPEWLYYKLMTLKEYFNGISYGAAIQNINTDIVRETKIFLPDLEIQTKQVQILKSIDELSKTYEDRIRIYESVLAELYNSWFINFKFPNHEQVEFVDGIPEGWTNVSLKEVISTNPSTLKKGELDEILYVDISSVGQGKIESFTQYHIDDAPGRAKRKVQHGDVIWSCVRPNRKQYALIQNPQSNLIVSTGFTVLRPTKIPFTYLTALAASDDFCGYLTSVAQGAAYPAVTYKDFEDYELLLPPKSLLDKFHEVVEPMYEQIHILQTQNQKLHDLKETLLPRLMSGELDVSKLSSIE
ncbi:MULTISPECIES: restriction endonuclease subunit S [unclassified Acinetobacter]|uniref:restriction endonuclease subunit S n=1 Tax=unclassified Acinetobacter TaxID=196816 RepID=UPI0015D20AA6|nr:MULTISPECIES: restriction endonuclease subunit S [unclassified Acinetobacter]